MRAPRTPLLALATLLASLLTAALPDRLLPSEPSAAPGPPSTAPSAPALVLSPPSTASAAPLSSPTLLHKVSVSMSLAEFTVLERDTYVQRGRGGFGGMGGFGPINTEDDIRLSDGRFVHIGGGFGGNFPWVHADVSFDGAPPIKDVAFRYKGNGSYNQGAGLHRNIKLKTDFFGGKPDWAGLETINLNSGGRDLSRERETLAFAVFRAAGVPAPRTSYAEVTYNVPGIHKEAYGGLFTVIENVNKQFLKHALPPGNGLLMKPERMNGGVGYYGDLWSNYIPIYRPERDATPREAARVIEFARLINEGSVDDFNARIESYLDVDEFFRFLAVNALIASRDSYLSGRHNYFIYLDPRDDKFRFIPWDEDGSLAGGNQNFGGTDLMSPWSSDNPLGYWLLQNPKFADRYRAIVREIVARVFNRDDLLKLVNSLDPVVHQPLNQESSAMMFRGEFNNPAGGPDPHLWIDQRLASLDHELAQWPAAATTTKPAQSDSSRSNPLQTDSIRPDPNQTDSIRSKPIPPDH